MSVLKRVFSWRTFRAVLFLGIALVTLAALVLAFENWRGKRSWLKFKAEAEAKGEKFDLASFIPPRVPDSENFAMTPLLAPLFDYTTGRGTVWRDSNAVARAQGISVSGSHGHPPNFGNRNKDERTDLRLWQAYYRSGTNFVIGQSGESAGGDILRALSKYDAILSELREATKRPHAVFPIHYDESISALLPHLSVMKSLVTVLRLHTLAALDANRPEEAWDDVRVSLRLPDALKSEPLLISQLVRIAMLRITADTVWEGIASGRWNQQHLADIETALSSINLPADYERAVRGERAFSNDCFQRMRAGHEYGGSLQGLARFAPRGLLYQNQLTINRMLQTYFFGAFDIEKHRLDIGRVTAVEKAIKGLRRHPYQFLAALLLPALEKSSFQFALGQTAIDQAAIACALERYRLTKGEYPSTLEQLKPDFIREIPNDVITGEPLHYSRTETNRFLLYSVGWNEKDDKGAPGKASSTPSREAVGDWVWTPASTN